MENDQQTELTLTDDQRKRVERYLGELYIHLWDAPKKEVQIRGAELNGFREALACMGASDEMIDTLEENALKALKRRK